MDKTALFKELAENAYNIGFGAKNYDIDLALFH